MADEDSAIELLSIGVPTEKVEALAKVIRSRGTAVHTKYAATTENLARILQDQDAHVILFHAGHAGESLDELLNIRGDSGSDAAVVVVGGDPSLLSQPGVRDWLANENDARAASVIMREQNDLTNRRQLMMARHRLQETEHRCDQLMESSKEAISYVHEGMHVRANPVYMELFDVPDADYMEGLPLMDLVKKESRQDLKRALGTTDFGTERALHLEAECQTMEGEEFSARLEFTPATIDGEPCVQIIVRRDLDVNSEEIERLQELAHRDQQTGLYHRTRFLNRLDDTIPRLYADNDSQYALIYISIDRFVEIRNSCGLDCAEGVLKEAASVINDQTDSDTLIGRFGDSTFTILVRVRSAEKAMAIGERLRSAIESHAFASAEHFVNPTVSVGVTRSKQGRVSSAQDFVDRGFKACQAAKSAGGNRVSEYDPAADQEDASPTEDDSATLDLVEFAIAHDRFVLLYQPILAIPEGSQDNYHAQLFLTDANDEMVPSSSFLHTAQAAGKLTEIDRWVISGSLPLLKESSPGNRPYHLHYSLSLGALKDPEFISWLRTEITSNSVNPEQITLVLNHQDVKRQMQATRDLCTSLKDLGCTTMLDGMGTSHKEDQALIKNLPTIGGARLSPDLSRDLETDPDVLPRLQEANQNIQQLGLRTLVTGVEHAGALAQSWAVGVNYIEGDFLSPPQHKLDFDFSQY